MLQTYQSPLSQSTGPAVEVPREWYSGAKGQNPLVTREHSNQLSTRLSCTCQKQHPKVCKNCLLLSGSENQDRSSVGNGLCRKTCRRPPRSVIQSRPGARIISNVH